MSTESHEKKSQEGNELMFAHKKEKRDESHVFDRHVVLEQYVDLIKHIFETGDMSNLPVLIECITLYISEDVPENLPYFKFIWLLCSRAYDLLWPLKTAKNEVEKKKSIDYKGMSNEGWKNIFCAGCALCCFCKLVPESSVAFFHGIISAYLFGYATFLYAMYMYMYNLEYACLICVGYTLANFDVKNKNSFLQFGVCSCVYFFVSENNMLL